ncbi:MAG: hypothetical protein ABL886_09260 [Rhodoglobus sp.]
MRTFRPLAVAAVVLALIATLSGCSLLPSTTSGGGSTDTSLAGTSWTGTDSDGDAWVFDFQADNTVGFTLNADSYDDASDTWAVAGGTLTITIVFTDGTATMVGPYTPGASSISLDGSQDGAVWSVDITQK